MEKKYKICEMNCGNLKPCPLHTPAEEKPWLKAAPNPEHPEIYAAPSPSSDSMEERFDKNWNTDKEKGGWKLYGEGLPRDTKAIKDFIRTELSLTEQATKERLKKLIQGMPSLCSCGNSDKSTYSTDSNINRKKLLQALDSLSSNNQTND